MASTMVCRLRILTIRLKWSDGISTYLEFVNLVRQYLKVIWNLYTVKSRHYFAPHSIYTVQWKLPKLLHTQIFLPHPKCFNIMSLIITWSPRRYRDPLPPEEKYTSTMYHYIHWFYTDRNENNYYQKCRKCHYDIL